MSKIINNILCTLMIFLLAFTWTYYCLKNAVWALALASVIAICSAYIIWRALSKIDDGKRLKRQQKKAVADFAEQLRFGENNAALFEEMLKYYGFDVSRLDYDNLEIAKNGEKSYAAVCFEQDSLTKDRLRQAVVAAKRAGASKLYVFTSKAEQALHSVANSHIKTVFIDAKNTYRLFEQCDKLPPITAKRSSKSSFVAKYAFCKQRFGWYFGSCLFLIAISVVSFFPWYTLAWSTVMLFLALYSLLNKKYNVIETRVKLD